MHFKHMAVAAALAMTCGSAKAAVVDLSLSLDLSIEMTGPVSAFNREVFAFEGRAPLFAQIGQGYTTASSVGRADGESFGAVIASTSGASFPPNSRFDSFARGSFGVFYRNQTAEALPIAFRLGWDVAHSVAASGSAGGLSGAGWTFRITCESCTGAIDGELSDRSEFVIGDLYGGPTGAFSDRRSWTEAYATTIAPGGSLYVDATGFAFTYAEARGVVPEPASWAMMILGFGLVGGLARRRARAAA